MEYRVFFSYEKKTIQIECTPKEEMQKIFEKFAEKLKVNINDFEFFYEGNKINKNSTFLELNKEENNKAIVVTVERKLKKVKCPQCICNDCVIEINNYKILFSDCKYNHKVRKIFDEYKETQKIDYSKIICCDNKCGVNQKDYPSDFYKCFKCTQLAHRTRYYCSKCNEQHKQKHRTIKNDLKDYYCEEHFIEFTNYCLECKKDLCKECKKNHKDHKIYSYDEMNPNIINDIKNVKTKLNEIRASIDDLKFIIDDMKDHLDGAMKIFEKYYEIGQDIIEKYELFNKDLKITENSKS